MAERNCTSNAAPPDATACKNTGLFTDFLIHIKHGPAFKPWWGERRSKNLQNAGFVIGFKTDAGHGWRLDYDVTKGIHVNEIIPTSDDRPYHVVTTFNAQPFGAIYPIPGLKRLTGVDLVRGLWLSWTKHYIVYPPGNGSPAATDQPQIMTAYADLTSGVGGKYDWGQFKKEILAANSVSAVGPFFSSPG